MNNYHRVVESVDESLAAMGLEYVDLLLVHWPNSELGDLFQEEPVVRVPMHKVWAQFEEVLASGKTKAIGVSNFNVQILCDLLTYCETPPAVN